MTCRVELRPHEGVPVENEMTIFLGKVSIRFDFPGDEQNSVPPDVKSSALLDLGLLCSASPSNLNPKSGGRVDEDKSAQQDSSDLLSGGSSISSGALIGRHAEFSVDTPDGEAHERSDITLGFGGLVRGLQAYDGGGAGATDEATMAYDGGHGAAGLDGSVRRGRGWGTCRWWVVRCTGGGAAAAVDDATQVRACM